MIEGYMPKQDVADMLLDLRNYVAAQMDVNEEIHSPQRIIEEFDLKLKEIT
jgi:hypothetical protein